MHTRATYNALRQSRTVQKGGSYSSNPPANHTLSMVWDILGMLHGIKVFSCILDSIISRVDLMSTGSRVHAVDAATANAFSGDTSLVRGTQSSCLPVSRGIRSLLKLS